MVPFVLSILSMAAYFGLRSFSGGLREASLTTIALVVAIMICLAQTEGPLGLRNWIQHNLFRFIMALALSFWLFAWGVMNASNSLLTLALDVPLSLCVFTCFLIPFSNKPSGAKGKPVKPGD